jgi:hypothetical protein
MHTWALRNQSKHCCAAALKPLNICGTLAGQAAQAGLGTLKVDNKSLLHALALCRTTKELWHTSGYLAQAGLGALQVEGVVATVAQQQHIALVRLIAHAAPAAIAELLKYYLCSHHETGDATLPSVLE